VETEVWETVMVETEKRRIKARREGAKDKRKQEEKIKEEKNDGSEKCGKGWKI